MFKKIFIVIATLFVIYFVLCFIGPKKWEASVTKTISGSPNMVYYQIADFKNWAKWSPWMRDDTSIKLTYGAASSGVGGSYTWTSKKSGNGSMVFTSQVMNENVLEEYITDPKVEPDTNKWLSKVHYLMIEK